MAVYVRYLRASHHRARERGEMIIAKDQSQRIVDDREGRIQSIEMYIKELNVLRARVESLEGEIQRVYDSASAQENQRLRDKLAWALTKIKELENAP
jgi:hypothetical protein